MIGLMMMMMLLPNILFVVIDKYVVVVSILVAGVWFTFLNCGQDCTNPKEDGQQT